MTDEPAPIAVGDAFPIDTDYVGDCSAEYRGVGGLIAMCVLDEGHGGPHVTSDGHRVVEVW